MNSPWRTYKREIDPYKRNARDLFNSVKRTANQRDITFLFEFEEWLQWWEDNLGKDWMSLRGQHKDQYVMARKGDKGPYASWNVECITQKENHDEYLKRRYKWT